MDLASMNVLIIALTPILLAMLTTIQLFNGWLARKAADAAATKAERVAEVAAQSVAKVDHQNAVILDVANKTHTLVNSQMGQQLMLYATTARTLANLTHDPAHLAAADAADLKLAEHQLKQSVVDDVQRKQDAMAAGKTSP
jgi:hypothetical protein